MGQCYFGLWIADWHQVQVNREVWQCIPVQCLPLPHLLHAWVHVKQPWRSQKRWSSRCSACEVGQNIYTLSHASFPTTKYSKYSYNSMTLTTRPRRCLTRWGIGWTASCCCRWRVPPPLRPRWWRNYRQPTPSVQCCQGMICDLSNITVHLKV